MTVKIYVFTLVSAVSSWSVPQNPARQGGGISLGAITQKQQEDAKFFIDRIAAAAKNHLSESAYDIFTENYKKGIFEVAGSGVVGNAKTENARLRSQSKKTTELLSKFVDDMVNNKNSTLLGGADLPKFDGETIDAAKKMLFMANYGLDNNEKKKLAAVVDQLGHKVKVDYWY